MKIGIFDSGIGGLSTLHQAMITLPEVDYCFYADTDHVPYGERTVEEIRGFVDHAVGFLVDKGCEAICLACNTATSAAITMVRQKYGIPVIGIEPAVKPAIAHCKDKRVLVIATPVTAKEPKLHNLVMKYDYDHKVDIVPMPGLVRLAQDGIFTGDKVLNYIHKAFADLNLSDYSELVLGCTHFNYFKDTFAKIFPDDVEIIDGNLGVAKHLRNTIINTGLITEEELKGRGSVTYYYSDRKIEDKDELEHIKALHQRLELMLKL